MQRWREEGFDEIAEILMRLPLLKSSMRNVLRSYSSNIKDGDCFQEGRERPLAVPQLRLCARKGKKRRRPARPARTRRIILSCSLKTGKKRSEAGIFQNKDGAVITSSSFYVFEKLRLLS